MAIYVADASALLAYLRKEDGFREVSSVFKTVGDRVLAHALNVCEVYYDTLRRANATIAVEAIKRLRADGMEVREIMDDTFWMDVGGLKVNPGNLSIADCAGIALARRESAELLTADHHEMDKLVGTGIVSLKFIR
jgi:PIN domain nuclease of toxin-antitoxin system